MNICTATGTRPADTLLASKQRAPAVAPAAHTGTLGDLIRLMTMNPREDVTGLDTTPIAVWRVREHSTLVHEGTRSQSLFVLRCGSMKCAKTLEDGYEQVLSFVQAGEVLGFEALHGGIAPASTVALEDSSVYVLPLRDLAHLQERCPALGGALQSALSRQLANAAATSELMAAVASEVRLARFLLMWSARMEQAGRSPRRMHLRMGRRDIASLIGVAHETVSRSFTMLADAGCLQVDNRDVEITDFDALRVRARSTRGLHTDGASHAADAAKPGRAASARQPAADRWPGMLRVANGD